MFFLFDKLYYPGFKSYRILLNKFEDPSTHSSQDLMEILDTILQSKLKFSFVLPRGYFFLILMEHRLGRGCNKNGPKIKID